MSHLERICEWAADRHDVRAPLGAVALAMLAGEVAAGARLRLRRRLAGVVARDVRGGGGSGAGVGE